MDGRCISQNELAKRWQISEATLERWRSQRKGLTGLLSAPDGCCGALRTAAGFWCKGDPFQTNPQSSWVMLGINEQRLG